MFTSGTADNYADLLDRLHTFLTAKGSAFGLTYSGTGDGTLTGYSGGASSAAETFTITATSATSFDVVGSISGSIGPATVGTPFAHAKLEFLISAGGTPFVAGDAFTLSTAPPWVGLRKTLGARVEATQGNTGSKAVQNIVDGKNAISDAYWRVQSPITLPQDVEFTFFEAETIASYQIASFMDYYSNYLPKSWTFQYWDGDSWETLDSQSNITGWTQLGIRTFEIASPVSATRYRLHITEIPSTVWLYMGAMRLLRSDGVDAAFSQTIWQAPGNDGDSEILVGVHAFERQDADYYNWELAAFDAYLATSLWREQAGHHSKLYMPLWDDTIPYWFAADGRRAIVVAKLNTQYEVGYLGLLDPFFSPEQWPYPIALGGSMAFGPTPPAWESTNWRWSNNTINHRAFTHSDPGSTINDDAEWHQMRARNWDGGWLGFASRSNDGTPYFPDHGVTWPYCCGLTLLDPNIDESYTLWPVMLNTAVPNTIGQLSGVACVSGQGLTAETMVRVGAIDWMALHDIFRTDRDDFLAIALD